MAEARERFLAHVPAGGSVLDAGCGSGRDTLAFRSSGYDVTAFDGSGEMARLAAAHTGLPVLHLTFDQITWRAAFGGVWASASLLHVPRDQLAGIVCKLAAAVRRDGAMYLSLKRGDGERIVDGRRFTDVTEQEIARLLTAAGMHVADGWLSSDVRPGRLESWVNVIGRWQ